MDGNLEATLLRDLNRLRVELGEVIKEGYLLATSAKDQAAKNLASIKSLEVRIEVAERAYDNLSISTKPITIRGAIVQNFLVIIIIAFSFIVTLLLVLGRLEEAGSIIPKAIIDKAQEYKLGDSE